MSRPNESSRVGERRQPEGAPISDSQKIGVLTAEVLVAEVRDRQRSATGRASAEGPWPTSNGASR